MEYETKSTVTQEDDLVIARNNNGKPAEQWVIKASKLSQLYEPEFIGVLEVDGIKWEIFVPKPDPRQIIIWDEAHTEAFFNSYGNKVLSQEDFAMFVSQFETQEAVKEAAVLIRPSVLGETIVTQVIKNPCQVVARFEAAWGEEMPVKEGDVIVVMENEVYRIARAEFDLTYSY